MLGHILRPEMECVEVAAMPGLVGVRDSKLGEQSPVLVVSAEDWRGFLAAVRG
ncbi:DUF397 domain-containing protein [Longispora sp. K20-0274]|uniref:DUF397 domain-containing protein n=1 Tax=Longispora sp. K20-0274 TaxID=3088255 RepID=UPI003999B656